LPDARKETGHEPIQGAFERFPDRDTSDLLRQSASPPFERPSC
jgi:hypothetical protein